MGRPPIGAAPMSPAERQKPARALTKQPATTAVMMSAGERRELLLIVRARERVALSDAKEYAVTLMAQFERKLATIYQPKDHPIWQEAHAAATKAAAEAQAKIVATFSALGIPEAWAPGLAVGWYGRGENVAAERRTELRRVAQSETERRLRRAEAAIKRAAVGAQENIMASGLTSEAAQAMLAALPTIDALMPELEVDTVEKLAAPDRTKMPQIEDY